MHRSTESLPLAARSRVLGATFDTVIDSLWNAQARSNARVVLPLAHGVGMESRYVNQVPGADVRPTPEGKGAVLIHVDMERHVHDAYAASLLSVAAYMPDRLLGTRSRAAAETIGCLNEALSASGYDLQVDESGLRTGWLE